MIFKIIYKYLKENLNTQRLVNSRKMQNEKLRKINFFQITNRIYHQFRNKFNVYKMSKLKIYINEYLTPFIFRIKIKDKKKPFSSKKSNELEVGDLNNMNTDTVNTANYIYIEENNNYNSFFKKYNKEGLFFFFLYGCIELICILCLFKFFIGGNLVYFFIFLMKNFLIFSFYSIINNFFLVSFLISFVILLFILFFRWLNVDLGFLKTDSYEMNSPSVADDFLDKESLDDNFESFYDDFIKEWRNDYIQTPLFFTIGFFYFFVYSFLTFFFAALVFCNFYHYIYILFNLLFPYLFSLTFIRGVPLFLNRFKEYFFFNKNESEVNKDFLSLDSLSFKKSFSGFSFDEEHLRRYPLRLYKKKVYLWKNINQKKLFLSNNYNQYLETHFKRILKHSNQIIIKNPLLYKINLYKNLYMRLMAIHTNDSTLSPTIWSIGKFWDEYFWYYNRTELQPLEKNILFMKDYLLFRYLYERYFNMSFLHYPVGSFLPEEYNVTEGEFHESNLFNTNNSKSNISTGFFDNENDINFFPNSVLGELFLDYEPSDRSRLANRGMWRTPTVMLRKRKIQHKKKGEWDVERKNNNLILLNKSMLQKYFQGFTNINSKISFLFYKIFYFNYLKNTSRYPYRVHERNFRRLRRVRRKRNRHIRRRKIYKTRFLYFRKNYFYHLFFDTIFNRKEKSSLYMLNTLYSLINKYKFSSFLTHFPYRPSFFMDKNLLIPNLFSEKDLRIKQRLLYNKYNYINPGLFVSNKQNRGLFRQMRHPRYLLYHFLTTPLFYQPYIPPAKFMIRDHGVNQNKFPLYIFNDFIISILPWYDHNKVMKRSLSFFHEDFLNLYKLNNNVYFMWKEVKNDIFKYYNNKRLYKLFEIQDNFSNGILDKSWDSNQRSFKLYELSLMKVFTHRFNILNRLYYKKSTERGLDILERLGTDNDKFFLSDIEIDELKTFRDLVNFRNYLFLFYYSDLRNFMNELVSNEFKYKELNYFFPRLNFLSPYEKVKMMFSFNVSHDNVGEILKDKLKEIKDNSIKDKILILLHKNIESLPFIQKYTYNRQYLNRFRYFPFFKINKNQSFNYNNFYSSFWFYFRFLNSLENILLKSFSKENNINSSFIFNKKTLFPLYDLFYKKNNNYYSVSTLQRKLKFNVKDYLKIYPYKLKRKFQEEDSFIKDTYSFVENVGSFIFEKNPTYQFNDLEYIKNNIRINKAYSLKLLKLLISLQYRINLFKNLKESSRNTTMDSFRKLYILSKMTTLINDLHLKNFLLFNINDYKLLDNREEKKSSNRLYFARNKKNIKEFFKSFFRWKKWRKFRKNKVPLKVIENKRERSEIFHNRTHWPLPPFALTNFSEFLTVDNVEVFPIMRNKFFSNNLSKENNFSRDFFNYPFYNFDLESLRSYNNILYFLLASNNIYRKMKFVYKKDIQKFYELFLLKNYQTDHIFSSFFFKEYFEPTSLSFYNYFFKDFFNYAKKDLETFKLTLIEEHKGRAALVNYLVNSKNRRFKLKDIGYNHFIKANNHLFNHSFLNMINEFDYIKNIYYKTIFRNFLYDNFFGLESPFSYRDRFQRMSFFNFNKYGNIYDYNKYNIWKRDKIFSRNKNIFSYLVRMRELRNKRLFQLFNNNFINLKLPISSTPIFNEKQASFIFFNRIGDYILKSIKLLTLRNNLLKENEFLLRKNKHLYKVNSFNKKRGKIYGFIDKNKIFFNLLLQKYNIFKEFYVYRSNLIDSKIKLKPIHNVILLLRLRKMNKKDNTFTFFNFNSLQKLKIHFSRFVFWLTRDYFKNLFFNFKYKNSRKKKYRKSSLNEVYYPSLFVDSLVKRKRPFFFFKHSKIKKSSILWNILNETLPLRISYFNKFYRKQRKLYRQFIMKDEIRKFNNNNLFLHNFYSGHNNPLPVFEIGPIFPRYRRSNNSLEDFFFFQSPKSKRPKRTLLKRPPLSVTASLTGVIPEINELSFLNKTAFYDKLVNFHYMLWMYLKLYEKSYTKNLKDNDYFSFKRNALLSIIKNKLNNDYEDFQLEKSYLISKKTRKYNDRYKQLLLRRKWGFVSSFFQKYFDYKINLLKQDNVFFTSQFERMLKHRKYNYILNKILNESLYDNANKLINNQFFFDWNYSFFDILNKEKKNRLSLFLKNYLIKRPKIVVSKGSFNYKHLSKIWHSINNILINSNSKGLVEIFPRYVSLNLRNNIHKAINKEVLKKKLLRKLTKKKRNKKKKIMAFNFNNISSKIKDPFLLYKEYPSYNLSYKSYNKRSKEMLKRKQKGFFNTIKNNWTVFYSKNRILNDFFLFLFKMGVDPTGLFTSNNKFVVDKFAKVLMEDFSLSNRILTKYELSNLDESDNFSLNDNSYENPRQFAFFYYFLIKKFNNDFLNQFDRYLKKNFYLSLRSENNSLKYIKYKKKNIKYWKSLKTKFNFDTQKSFLLWIKHRYGNLVNLKSDKNMFLWDKNIFYNNNKEFISLNQENVFPPLASHYSQIPEEFEEDDKLLTAYYNEKLHPGWRRRGNNEREKRDYTGESQENSQSFGKPFVFLKPKASFIKGNIRIPLKTPRDFFFFKRQIILRELRKFIFAFKATTSFLYINYRILGWNDRLINHSEKNFLDFSLEETIVSRTNDLFIKSFLNYTDISSLKNSENLDLIINSSLFPVIMDQSVGLASFFYMKLSTFKGNLLGFFKTNYDNFSLPFYKVGNSFSLDITKRFNSFLNIEGFLRDKGDRTLVFNELNNLSIEKLTDIVLAESFRNLSYEQIIKLLEEYNNLILERKYQRFLNLKDLFEGHIVNDVRDIFFIKDSFFIDKNLEPFFSSSFKESFLVRKFDLLQVEFFSYIDHFFNILTNNLKFPINLIINFFDNFTNWVLFQKSFHIHSAFYNFLSSYFNSMFFIKNFDSLLFYLFKFSIFLESFLNLKLTFFLTNLVSLDWLYSSFFISFLFYLPVSLSFFFIYFLSAFLFFFWFIRMNFFKKSSIFIDSSSSHFLNLFTVNPSFSLRNENIGWLDKNFMNNLKQENNSSYFTLQKSPDSLLLKSNKDKGDKKKDLKLFSNEDGMKNKLFKSKENFSNLNSTFYNQQTYYSYRKFSFPTRFFRQVFTFNNSFLYYSKYNLNGKDFFYDSFYKHLYYNTLNYYSFNKSKFLPQGFDNNIKRKAFISSLYINYNDDFNKNKFNIYNKYLQRNTSYSSTFKFMIKDYLLEGSRWLYYYYYSHMSLFDFISASFIFFFKFILVSFFFFGFFLFFFKFKILNLI